MIIMLEGNRIRSDATNDFRQDEAGGQVTRQAIRRTGEFIR